jgi:hypothetical protein
MLIQVSSSTPPVPPQPQMVQLVGVADMTDEQKLLNIYREYGPAKTRHERAFFERVESENFILFLRDRNMTREQNIRWMESWPGDVVFEYDIESIRIMGDTAVVTGRMWEHYPKGGQNSIGFVDVCVRSGVGWRIMSTKPIY